MLDSEIEDQLILKVGGKLRLTSLMQKRLVELKRGARPLVEVENPRDLQDVVIHEILEDKIELADRAECQPNFMQDVRRLGKADEQGDDKEIYGSDLKRIKEARIKELSAFLNPTKDS
ncbi:MAG: DNA-directed RNA polymerase subunit omega [Planctomycetota bacterium]|jgi:DNA-directed RNA polymerase subunit omega